MNTKVNGAGFLSLLLLFTALSHLNWKAVSLHTDMPLLKGDRFAAIERDYNDAFLAKALAVNFWAAMDYLLFSEGRPGVLLGEEDWLFTSEEVNNTPFNAPDVTKKLDFISTAHNQIQENGSELFVVVLPSKARVYEQYLPVPLPENAKIRYELFENWLANHSISTVSLLNDLNSYKAPLNEVMYLKNDTHWSPAGSLAAANAIAKQIKTKVISVQWNQVSFVTDFDGPPQPYEGDLLNYLPLRPYFSFLLPEQPLIQRLTTRRKVALGLFDEVQCPVTLVGTSYSAKPEWNFVGNLQATLGVDVLDYSAEGVGPFEPMKSYLNSSAFSEHPPQVVLWEIPERYLVVDAKKSGL